jgi:hypothetical protein
LVDGLLHCLCRRLHRRFHSYAYVSHLPRGSYLSYTHRIDWYDVNATAFKNYLEDYHTTFQRPLWVTEWACQNFNDKNKQCSQNDIVLFLNETQTFMDNTDWVERYSWFGAMTDMQGVNGVSHCFDFNNFSILINFPVQRTHGL